MAAVNAVKKLLIPALLMLLIGAPLAWSQTNFFSTFVPNSPLLTSPALSGDAYPIVRSGATYRVPLAGRGVVTLTRPLSGALDATIPWLVTRPDFATQNCAGTVSSCFNEAEADAFASGWSVHVIGCGEYLGEGSGSPLCGISANSSAGFVLKPLADRMVIFDGVQFHCQGAANQGCVNVDSMMKGKIVCQGCEIVSEPTSGDSTNTCAWRFKATTAIPNENVIGIQDSTVELGNFGTQPGSGTGHAALCIDLTNGGFNHMLVYGNEPNTGGPGNVPFGNYDIIVENSNGTTGFGGNTFNFAHVHFAKITSIKIGDATHPTFYAQNLWKIGSIHPGFNGSIGIDTYGSNDIFEIGNILNSETGSGSYLYAIQAESGAVFNTFTVGALAGASGASGNNPGINELSGWLNNYTVNGKVLNKIGPANEIINGLAPTGVHAGTCGTGASLEAGSTNHSFTLKVGTGNPNPTHCIVDFSITYPNPPRCLATPSSDPGGRFWIGTRSTTQTGFYVNAAIADNGQIPIVCQ